MSSNVAQNALGIQLAIQCLSQNGFQSPLPNKFRGKFPDQYITTECGGINYVIGVVSRKEIRVEGMYNESYNIANSRSDIERARRLPIVQAKTPAFVALPLQPLRGIFSAYFGLLEAIGFQLSIPMLPEDRLRYEQLAPETHDPRLLALV